MLPAKGRPHRRNWKGIQCESFLGPEARQEKVPDKAVRVPFSLPSGLTTCTRTSWVAQPLISRRWHRGPAPQVTTHPKQAGLACGHGELTYLQASRCFQLQGVTVLWSGPWSELRRVQQKKERTSNSLRAPDPASRPGTPSSAGFRACLGSERGAFWGPAEALGTGTNAHYLE